MIVHAAIRHPTVLVIGLFVVAMLPLLIDNLRNGTATNRDNLILALAGIASLVIGHLWGWNRHSLWAASAWIAMGCTVLMLISILGLLPAGVAKTMMALLPWFTISDYLLMIAVGFILCGIVAWMGRRSIPVALPLIIASIGIWIYDFSTYMAA